MGQEAKYEWNCCSGCCLYHPRMEPRRGSLAVRQLDGAMSGYLRRRAAPDEPC